MNAGPREKEGVMILSSFSLSSNKFHLPCYLSRLLCLTSARSFSYARQISRVWLLLCSLSFLFPPFAAHSLDNMLDYLSQRSPWTKISGYPQALSLGFVFFRNYPAAYNDYVLSTLLLQKLDNLWESSHVRTVKKAQSNHIYVFIYSYLSHLFWSWEKPRIDHFHSRVPESSCQYKSSSIVTV